MITKLKLLTDKQKDLKSYLFNELLFYPDKYSISFLIKAAKKTGPTITFILVKIKINRMDYKAIHNLYLMAFTNY